MTIKDVADLAGVSTATVSRVINRRPGVSDINLLKVKQAMDDVGYEIKEVRPGPVPRMPSQAGVSTKCMGLIIVGRYHEIVAHPLMVKLVSELRSAMKAAGYHLILEEMDPKDESCHAIREKRLEGAMVITGVEGSSAALSSISTQVPTVRVLGGDRGFETLSHVGMNNRQIGEMAFKYLQSLNPASLAFVNFVNKKNESIIDRGRAFYEAAMSTGLPVAQFLAGVDGLDQSRFYCGETIVGCSDEALMTQLEECSTKPVGIFVSIDDHLSFVMSHLAAAGWESGRDFHIIGCGNIEYFKDQLESPAATIDMGISEIAYQAVRTLSEQINKPSTSALEILVTPRLITSD